MLVNVGTLAPEAVEIDIHVAGKLLLFPHEHQRRLLRRAQGLHGHRSEQAAEPGGTDRRNAVDDHLHRLGVSTEAVSPPPPPQAVSANAAENNKPGLSQDVSSSMLLLLA
jgi:hypothetical protein